ncbi:MAG: response regulator [Flavobacteriales bacterium]|jgi:DNA-binding response OmpR family regulator|nr:response regulator [Flavobacteriales bacterium]
MKNSILIVDDEPSIVMSLDFLLRKENYEVFIARDGQEALDLIEENIPDLILLDIMMPKVDGYQVIEQLKSSQKHQHIKIIFLTAKTKENDIKRGLELGADLYIPKPFSTKKLVSEVNKLLA